MNLTWVVIAVIIVALLVFGLLLFLTDITGHEEAHSDNAGEAGSGSSAPQADPSTISSEFRSSVHREDQSSGDSE